MTSLNLNGGTHSKDSFKLIIKEAFKTEDWYYFSGVVDRKIVRLKLFPGVKEVDVQIFNINGIHIVLPRNYSTKKDTLEMILNIFSDDPI